MAELEELHRKLRDYGYAKKAQPREPATTIIATATAGNWLAAANGLVATLAAGVVVRSLGAAYEIVEEADSADAEMDFL